MYRRRRSTSPGGANSYRPAYGDVEQAEAGGLRQAPQNHVARPSLAAVQDPECTLPEPDRRPELAVVKVGRDLVVAGRGGANDEHAVANGEVCAAPLAVEAAIRPAEGAAAAGAAERSGIARRPTVRERWSPLLQSPRGIRQQKRFRTVYHPPGNTERTREPACFFDTFFDNFCR
jgi:hypothetical protein